MRFEEGKQELLFLKKEAKLLTPSASAFADSASPVSYGTLVLVFQKRIFLRSAARVIQPRRY
jgi:hypothetical protein